MIKYVKCEYDINKIEDILQSMEYWPNYSGKLNKIANSSVFSMYSRGKSKTGRVVVIRDSKSDRVLILEEDINIYAYLTELGIVPKLTMDDIQYYNS